MFFVAAVSTDSLADSRHAQNRPPRHAGKAGVTENGGQMNELQDLVLARLAAIGGDEPLSLRDVERRSNGLVSFETIRSIARGIHSGRITDRTAEGLSVALQVPVERIYAAAGIVPPSGRWEWPARFDRLSQSQRRVVEGVASALLDAYEMGRRSAE